MDTNYTTAMSNWFADASIGDLRLAANNPIVVDQGSILADVSMDIDQTPRPLVGVYDIGAHEFVVDFIFSNSFE